MIARLLLCIIVTSGICVAAPGDIDTSFAIPSSCPSGLAFDGQNIWMADFKTDSLYAINPKTGELVKAMESPSYRAYGMAWDGSHLWIVDREEMAILQFDPQSGVNVRTIPSPLEEPTGLTWDGDKLWLADKSSINKISTVDGTTIKLFKAPSRNTTGLAFDGTYLWAADRGRNKIYMIYPETGEVIMIIDAPAPYAWGLAFADGRLYNVDYQDDSLYRVITDDDEFYSRDDSQRQNMNFTHEVRNYGPGTLKSLDIYLAIPENSAHQEILAEPVYFSDVTPQYLTDKWGQHFAAFHFENIPAGEKARAAYFVTADLYETSFYVRPEKVGKAKDIPKEITSKFLGDDTKFDMQNPIIQNAVKEAVGEETNLYWKARRIYNWVNDTLYYELAGGWNVAPAIIERGNGSCSEYTFVFMSMCRAAGIPARYTGSIAVRGDRASEDEVFHRWCEIYLPPYGWFPVDPSRGDSDSPETQALGFGSLSKNLLVTTTGAGSEYIGWKYNSAETWESEGKCKVFAENIGEWTPADESAEAVPVSMDGAMYCRPK
jgi:hypothetical protein